MSESQQQVTRSGVIDVRTLRAAFGILGLLFPFILIVGSFVLPDQRWDGLWPSISAYHHHKRLGMAYSGVLWAIGIFLFAYTGVDRDEDWAGYVACIGALLTAIFPAPILGDDINGMELAHAIHLFGTVVILGSFLVFSWKFVRAECGGDTFLFWWYAGCAVLITFGGTVALGVTIYRKIEDIAPTDSIIFWCESAIVWSFSAAWLARTADLYRRGVPDERIKSLERRVTKLERRAG